MARVVKNDGISTIPLIGVLSVTVTMLLWLAVTNLTGLVPSTILAGPLDVWDSFVEYAQQGFAGHTLTGDLIGTLGRVAIALILAMILFFPLGVAIGLSSRLSAICSPIIELGRPVPSLAYLPLLVIWFGVGEFSKILLLLLAAAPPILLVATDSVRKITVVRVDGAKSLGASASDVFWRLVIPSVWPDVLIAVRVSLGITYGTIVAVGLISAGNNLGAAMLVAGQFGRLDLIFAIVVLMGLTGALMDKGLEIIYVKTCQWARYR